MCVLEDQVLEAVKIKTYNGCPLMIESVKFCHQNLNKFVVSQFDSTILIYDVYQVSKYTINLSWINMILQFFYRKIHNKLFSIEN